jgi:hypothetical protein
MSKSTNWERRLLLAEIWKHTGTLDADRVMDWLQERGLVADAAVKLEDVPTGDLLKAIRKNEEKLKN